VGVNHEVQHLNCTCIVCYEFKTYRAVDILHYEGEPVPGQ